MSHSSLLAGRSPGFKRRRRTASISVSGWKGGSPRGASSPRRFKRPCRFKLDSTHLMRWIQRCSVGCNKRMTRTADRAPDQSVRTNSFPSGSAIVAFQFPHGFFSGRSVTVPPFRSITRAASLHVLDGEVDSGHGASGAPELALPLNVHRERRAPRNSERGGLSLFVLPDLVQTTHVMIESAGFLDVADMHPDRVELSNWRHRH